MRASIALDAADVRCSFEVQTIARLGRFVVSVVGVQHAVWSMM